MKMTNTNDKGHISIPFAIAMNDQYLTVLPENEDPYTIEITWDYQEQEPEPIHLETNLDVESTKT